MTTSQTVTRALPEATGPLYQPFFAGLLVGDIVVPECTECGRVVWPPRPLCPSGHDRPIGARALPPRGVVHAAISCQRAFHPWFKDRIPYTIVTVDLGEGVRMFGNLLDPDTGDSDPGPIAAGDDVAAIFSEAIRPGTKERVVLLDWARTERSGLIARADGARVLGSGSDGGSDDERR